MEEDIVFASVRHALDQGVQRVYLIDNGSTDSTVGEAVAAGATLVMTFSTEKFDEIFKYRLINEQIAHLSAQSGLDQIWWLMMDADEFTTTPNEASLPSFLGGLDPRCRIVGARVLDHYPVPGSHLAPRAHPLSMETLCLEKSDQRCMLGHHKHPAFLWKQTQRRIVVEPGFHQLWCKGEALYEPDRSLVLDHFPYRNEEEMRRRLTRLMERGVTAESHKADADRHMRARLQSLDAVYQAQFDRVIDYRTGKAGITVADRATVLGVL